MIVRLRILARIMAACMILAVIAAFAQGYTAYAKVTGNTYYVSPEGNNKNSGSVDKPFKTVVYACRKLKPGDTLILREGTYIQDPITSYGMSGTKEAPVVIKAYKGEAPVIDGGKYGMILNLTDRNYYSIEGIGFTNGTSTIAGSSHVSIRSCTFKKAGIRFISSQKADTSYAVFENNYLTDFGDYGTDGEGDGIYLLNTNRCLIQNNYLAKCGHYAINDYGTLDIIRNNIIEQNWGGGVSAGERTLIEGNRIYYVNDHVDYPKADIMCCNDNNIVRNNIFAHGSDGPYAGGGMELGGFANNMHATGNRIYNNIFYKNGSTSIDFNMKFNSIVTDNKLFNNILYYDNASKNWASGGDTAGAAVFFSAYFSSKETAWGKNFPNKNMVYNNIMLRADGNGDHPGYEGYFEYITGEGVEGSFKKSLLEIEKAYPKYFFKNLEKAPLFLNPDSGDIYSDDFHLGKGSPAIDAGAHMAKTTAQGTKTITVKADDVNSFFDGFGVVDGDALKIGNNPIVRVVKIDYKLKTITVSKPVTYQKGDYINLPFSGSAPDIGAYETNPPAVPKASKGVAAPAPVRRTEELKRAAQIELDDWIDIGRTIGRIDYYGPWSAYVPGQGQYSGIDQDGAYKKTLHKSASNYGYYQVKFYGTGVKVIAPLGPAFGIASVTVDNGEAVDVDFYSKDRKDQITVFEKTGLNADEVHTLKVVVTGNKNTGSIGNTIPCDRISVNDAAQKGTNQEE